MERHELFLHYWKNPPQKPVPPPVVQSDETQIVMPYHLWMKNKCACCGKGGCSGIWMCDFGTYRKQLLMCAPCGLGEAYRKWTGFFGPKLHTIDLVITLTYPNRTETSHDRSGQEGTGTAPESTTP